ncbi:MAG: InlB B-repeat-containing protein [Treponema sp.]|nr:InlB B-repeat-containing protein [Treponema sp.]
MQQNTDCNGYTEVLSETKYGKAGETVVVTKNASLYEGFTLVDFELPTIAADGSTEVILYYDRNIYTLSYDDGVENETISVPDSKEYPYGASVDLTTVTVPTRTGYNFGGWLLDTDLLGEEFTMPAENTMLTAKWNVKDGIEYTVRHYLQMVDANDYVEDEKALYTGSGKTGENTNASPKNYAGFKNREFSQEPIKADGTTEIKIYYDRNMHSVSYDLNGVGEDEGEDSLKVPEKKDYRFGTMDIPVNFPDSYKNFAGYEFLGWAKTVREVNADRKESDADFKENGTKSFEMGDSNVVLYAVWKLKTDVTYTVKHLGQSLESDDKYIEIHDSTILHGTTGKDTAGTSLTIIGFTEKEVETKPISRKGDTVIEYLYTRNKYTLKYDQNMPKEWTEDPECHADDVLVPESASYRFESVVPYATATINDEDGYDFSGWATSANAEAADYSENFKLDADLVARANKDNEITLYAVWNPKDITYKVEHYKQNIDDDNYTLIEPVSTENASAWTSVDAADKKIEIEGFEYASKVDVKLNPHADNNVAKIYYNRRTASLTYDANGGSEITNSKTTYRYGKVVDLNFAGVSRKGYDFLGWASASDANEPEYTSGGTKTVTMGTENKTLYAVWTESTYTLKYDLNLPAALAADGRANITAPDDDSKKYLTTVIYTPATINDEDGYTFLGWAKASDATEPQYTKDFPVDANLVPSDDSKTITLYAVWKAQEIEYTVKYWQQNLDAGTDFNKDEYTEVSSASKTLKAEVWTTTAVSADEGKFTGFVPLKTDNVTINPHTSNVVNVYYDRVKGKVYYDANDGGEFYYDDNNEKIYNNPPQDSNSYRYEETVTVKFSMSRQGYDFLGWASASNAPEPEYTSGGTNTITMGTNDVTLYAVWEAKTGTVYKVVHLKQNLNNDDYTVVEADTQTKTGTTATETTAEAKTYTGFTAGFSKNKNPEESLEQEIIKGDGSTIVEIYYNRKKYNITYDSNLNSIGKTSTVDIVLPSDSNKYRYEADVTVSFDGNISDVSVVRGYSFVGWNTSSAVDKALYSSDGTTSFTINETIDNLVSDTNNLTLYAIWQANNVSGKTEDGGESTENNGINITTPEYPASDSDTELISSTDATTGDGEYVTFTINTEAIAAIVDKEKMSNLVYTWYLGRTEITSEVTSEDNNLTFNWDSSNRDADNYSIMLKLTGTDESGTTKVYSQTVYFNLEK